MSGGVVSVFRNEEEGRLRAPWRLAVHGVLLVACTFGAWLVLSVPFAVIGRIQPGPPAEMDGAFIPWSTVVPWVLAALVGSVLSTWLAAHWIDDRRFRDLGMRMNSAWWADLGFGLALGIAAVAAVVVFEVRAGWAEITRIGPVQGGMVPFLIELAIAAIIFSSIGFYEELVARGYQTTNLAEGFNFPPLGRRGAAFVALVLTSLAFGLLHGTNPGSTALGVANIALSGLLPLGLPYVLTGRLGLSVGLHISWNFAHSFIFGLPVSGAMLGSHSLMVTDVIGPEMWTGGAFGPEGGLLGTLAIMAECAVALLWIRLREGKLTIREDIADPPGQPGGEA
ncbi:MAG: CPBP family intramembrane metalloprotease [Armatimonadia bacterium]|nr:CPBP family intramembrane metalloprotease [Armatimonadia bacterium]